MNFIFGDKYKKESNEFDDGSIVLDGSKIQIEVKEQTDVQWLDIIKYARGWKDGKHLSDAIFVYYSTNANGLKSVKNVLIVDMDKWIKNHFKGREHWFDDPKYIEYVLENKRDGGQSKTSFSQYKITDKEESFRGCIKFSWPVNKAGYRNGV